MADPKPPPFSDSALDALRPRAKAALRKRYRNVRASLPAAARALRSEAIARNVMALDAWQGARTVAVFASLSDEVDLSLLVADARARGVTVCLPRVVEGRDDLEFRVAWEGERALPTTAGVWGIQEPTDEAPVVPTADLDLIVVPALAIDGAGFRLGYGRGYYDRTLPLATRAVTVGVVFEFLLLAEIPAEPHDVAVRWIVTDQRTLRADPPARSPMEKP